MKENALYVSLNANCASFNAIRFSGEKNLLNSRVMKLVPIFMGRLSRLA